MRRLSVSVSIRGLPPPAPPARTPAVPGACRLGPAFGTAKSPEQGAGRARLPSGGRRQGDGLVPVLRRDAPHLVERGRCPGAGVPKPGLAVQCLGPPDARPRRQDRDAASVGSVRHLIVPRPAGAEFAPVDDVSAPAVEKASLDDGERFPGGESSGLVPTEGIPVAADIDPVDADGLCRGEDCDHRTAGQRLVATGPAPI